MPVTVSLLCVLALRAGAEAPPADKAAPEPPPAKLIDKAHPERLGKLYIYVQEKHPDLVQDALVLMNRRYPEFWGVVKGVLHQLAADKHPTLLAEVQAQTLAILARERPELQRAVFDFINTRYPLLKDEIPQIINQNPDTDPQPEIAKLLREKYPSLMGEVFDEIIMKHPRVLSQIVNAVAARVPPLMTDVMKQVQKRFPRLPRDIFQMAMKKHPDLIEAANKILRGEPLEEEAEKRTPADGPAPEPEKEKAPPPE